MAKWICVQFRDPDEWHVVGQTRYQKRDVSAPFARRAKMRYVQDTYTYPHPEDASPFVRRHRIVDAESPEEALKQCQT